MKTLRVYSPLEIEETIKYLVAAKTLLDGDGASKIIGCKAAIDIAIRRLEQEEDDRVADYE